MNHLYFGDCLDVLCDLKENYTQPFIDLIYIDPPFNSSKRNYNVLFESMDMLDANAICGDAKGSSSIGISKNNLKKIFDKYYRIEDHATPSQGLGIGLFISYEIIQRRHGKLWAESEQGKGSTFYFTMPATK